MKIVNYVVKIVLNVIKTNAQNVLVLNIIKIQYFQKIAFHVKIIVKPVIIINV